jgi:hypothetical protein
VLHEFTSRNNTYRPREITNAWSFIGQHTDSLQMHLRRQRVETASRCNASPLLRRTINFVYVASEQYPSRRSPLRMLLLAKSAMAVENRDRNAFPDAGGKDTS